MVPIGGEEAREIWLIFKLFRRARRAVAAHPEDALVALQAIVETLDRAFSPIIGPCLTLKRHERTLAGTVCAVMA